MANEKDFKEFDMTIEITGRTNSPTPIKTAPKASVDGDKKVSVAAESTVKTDSVALTASTQEIKKAFGSTSGSPVDIDRVSSIKKALADGSYSVNADKIAKKQLMI